MKINHKKKILDDLKWLKGLTYISFVEFKSSILLFIYSDISEYF